jgi:hypothetical protein
VTPGSADAAARFDRTRTGHQGDMAPPAPTGEHELRIAFVDPGGVVPEAVAIHVNFGILSGREATLAEIDRLAGALLARAERLTIVSEVRHEIDRHSEAAVHQVRIEVPAGDGDRVELERWLVDEAERWARRCIAERTGGAASPDLAGPSDLAG